MPVKLFLAFLFLCLVLPLFAVAQIEVNYEESKVPQVTIPDLFVDTQGNLNTSKQSWESKRRPELLSLFENFVYGKLPTDFDQQTFQEELVATHVHADYARLKQVRISVSRNSGKQTILLKIYYPKDSKGPFPVFLLISHRNVDQVSGNPENQFFPVQKIVSRGYAAAIFDVEDVSPDNPSRFKDGILTLLYPEQLGMPHGMRGLSAWAWGAMRAMDYF